MPFGITHPKENDIIDANALDGYIEALLQVTDAVWRANPEAIAYVNLQAGAGEVQQVVDAPGGGSRLQISLQPRNSSFYLSLDAKLRAFAWGSNRMRLSGFLYQEDKLDLCWALCVVSLDQLAGVFHPTIVVLLGIRTPGDRGVLSTHLEMTPQLTCSSSVTISLENSQCLDFIKILLLRRKTLIKWIDCMRCVALGVRS